MPLDSRELAHAHTISFARTSYSQNADERSISFFFFGFLFWLVCVAALYVLSLESEIIISNRLHFQKVSCEGRFKLIQFAPGSCSQMLNRFNAVEQFTGWKFFSRERITPVKLLVHMDKLCYRNIPLEQNPSVLTPFSYREYQMKNKDNAVI